MPQAKSHTDHPIRIIGGGMTGLTLAYRLSTLGHRVVVHERDPYLGGLASEGELGGVPVERFYHCVLPTDTALLALFDELGLRDAVGWTRTRTGFFSGGRLLEMTTTRDFLRFPALHLLDRLRLGWTIAWCGMNPTWKRLDREPIGPFLRRHSGRRVFESIWEPLLVAKLGPDYDRFAASFIWATVYRMLAARKAKGRSEKLGYVSGRYGQVFAALRSSIERLGGEVIVGESVEGIERSAADMTGWTVKTSQGSVQAVGVVLCIPATIAAEWVEGIAAESAHRLRAVNYLGVICDVLLLKKSLTPYYVLNLTDRSLPFTGVIETSNLVGREEYGGDALVYLPRYCDQNSIDWKRTDEEIHRENVSALQNIVPDFSAGDVVAWQMNRARAVQPIHPIGWGDQLPPVRLAPGLAYVSTAQIHPWPVFNDEVVRNVDRSLATVLEVLRVS